MLQVGGFMPSLLSLVQHPLLPPTPHQNKKQQKNKTKQKENKKQF